MLVNEEKLKNQPEYVIAIVNQWNGGKYGRSGQYRAIVKPEYFRNGNVKMQSFEVVQVLEIIKRDYGYNGCNHRESLAEIVEVLK